MKIFNCKFAICNLAPPLPPKGTEMLRLTLYRNESLRLDGPGVIHILGHNNNRIEVSVDAPASTSVLRSSAKRRVPPRSSESATPSQMQDLPG